MTALLGGLMLALTVPLTCWAAGVLDGVTRLAVRIEIRHPVDDLAAAALERQVAASLARLQPAIVLDERSAVRVHLTIAVRSYSSAELRGFPLPFSGIYAIGTVRLTLRRDVEIVGRPGHIVSASVWEQERPIASTTSQARAAIQRAVDVLLDDLGAVRSGSR